MQGDEEFDYRDNYIQHPQRKLFSKSLNKKSPGRSRRKNEQDMNRIERVQKENLAQDNNSVSENQNNLQNQNKMVEDKQYELQKENKMVEENKHVPQRQNSMVDDKKHKMQKENKKVEENQHVIQNQHQSADENQRLGWKDEVPGQNEDKELIGQVNHTHLEDKAPVQDPRSGAEPHVDTRLKIDTETIFLPLANASNPQPHENDSIIQKDPHDNVHHDQDQDSDTGDPAWRKGGDLGNRGGANKHKYLTKEEAELWVMYGDSETEARIMNRAVYDPEIRWDRTFHVSQTDFQMLRTDWIDLNCNVSGNLLLSQSEVTAVVQAFMEKLELKYPRYESRRRHL